MQINYELPNKKMNKEKKNKYWTIISYAIIFSIGFFIVFGIVTVLIPNKFFARMTPIYYLDYIFLVLTSILLGTYVSFYRYQKKHSNKTCTAAAYGGGIFGFLGFGCSICNKILILLLGVAGVLTYIEPYRPFIGFAGIGLMSYAVYNKGKNIMW
jgi:cytochrome c biogenesis protein CcdA